MCKRIKKNVAGQHFDVFKPASKNALIEKTFEANEAVVKNMAPNFGKRG